MTSKPVDVAVLHEMFVVRRGELLWRRTRIRSLLGKPAGSVDSKGYRIVKVRGLLLKVHRVIWAMAYGEWPNGDLDHKNGVRSDNRLTNLRIADRSQNMWNRKPMSNNRSGVPGVHKTPRGKWVAQLQVRKVKVLRAMYDTFEDAVAARTAALRKYHGKYARRTE